MDPVLNYQTTKLPYKNLLKKQSQNNQSYKWTLSNFGLKWTEKIDMKNDRSLKNGSTVKLSINKTLLGKNLLKSQKKITRINGTENFGLKWVEKIDLKNDRSLKKRTCCEIINETLLEKNLLIKGSQKKITRTNGPKVAFKNYWPFKILQIILKITF